MQQVTELMVQLQGTTIIAVTVLFAIGAMSTAFGFAILGSKFLECVARQPEMASMLQSKLYLLAAFIDAISMIAVGVGFFFIFANPFVAQLLEYVAPVIAQ